jgi:SAM-dependent methyltransferase
MFSSEWNDRYVEKTHLSIWPWSDLVSIVYRLAKRGDVASVLELGTGAGANVPLFLRLGMHYTGIEGSESIVRVLEETYSSTNCDFVCSDFTNLKFNTSFDLVIDRASLTHNDTISIKRTLANLSRAAKLGSKFIGVDWFSTEHSDFVLGDYVDDNTRTNIMNGQFTGTGSVHFSDKQHIVELFSEAGYMIETMQHKIVRTEIPTSGHVFAAWNFVAVKV